jgi:hypothetical protein
LPHRAPPAADGVDRERRRIVIDGHADPAFVVGDIVDAIERDEEKWVPVFRSSSRSQCKNEITVHDFGLVQSKIIVISGTARPRSRSMKS